MHRPLPSTKRDATLPASRDISNVESAMVTLIMLCFDAVLLVDRELAGDNPRHGTEHIVHAMTLTDDVAHPAIQLYSILGGIAAVCFRVDPEHRLRAAMTQVLGSGE